MKNIILIGMPGCGKSTVGVVLAKNIGFDFLDSDLLIQKKTGKRLSTIIEEEGLLRFIEIEDMVNASIEEERTVIATGGSVIYGENAMTHLKKIGTVIYMKLSYESIFNRLGNLTKRGVAIKEGTSLKELYLERMPLYEKYADITIDCENKQIREIVDEITELYINF